MTTKLSDEMENEYVGERFVNAVQDLEDESDRRAATINGLTVALQSMKAERDAMHDAYVRGLKERESLERERESLKESLTLVRRAYVRVLEERDAARLQALRECRDACRMYLGSHGRNIIQALINAEENKDGDT